MEPVKSLSTAGRVLTRDEVEELLRAPIQLMSYWVRQRHFPHLANNLHPGDLSLSVRVQNCLKNLKASQGVTDLSQLSRFTIGELLHLNNFGRKSLIDLLTSVMPMILDNAARPFNDSCLDNPMISASVTGAAERLRSQSYSASIHCTDPRFKSEVGTLLYIANSSSDDPPLGASATLHTVAHRLVGRSRDNKPPELTLGTIRKIRYKVARARRMPLEKELEEITRAFAQGRKLEIIVSFLGWGGRGVKTLQAVGNEFQITRERVRQVTSKFIGNIRQVQVYAPTLKRTIFHINMHITAAMNDAQTDLCQKGITKSLFCLDGVVNAARLLGVSAPFVIEEHNGIQMAVRHEDMGLSKFIVGLAKRRVSHAGLGKVGDLCDLVQNERGTSIEGSAVARILQSLASLHWLDERKEWFLLDNTRRNHLVGLVAKVLSVAPSIHVNEMRAAIAGDLRGMGFAPPKNVVLEFCRIACRCKVEGDTIVAKFPPPVAEVLSKAEQIAYSILAEYGPLLHRSDFERKCIERGMNASTFSVYLGRAPIIARYGPGVYGLRGAHVVPGDVQRCIPPTMSRLHDHGWTANAMLWLAVELSPAALSSGVIGVPAEIQRFVAGKYLLRTQDGSEVGKLAISGYSGWGLGPLFRKRGGEPGDVLVLTFDLQRHEAIGRIGTKEDVFANVEEFGATPATSKSVP
jgi:hypothetical protein